MSHYLTELSASRRRIRKSLKEKGLRASWMTARNEMFGAPEFGWPAKGPLRGAIGVRGVADNELPPFYGRLGRSKEGLLTRWSRRE